MCGSCLPLVFLCVSLGLGVRCFSGKSCLCAAVGVLTAEATLQIYRQPSDTGGVVGSTLTFFCSATGEASSLRLEWQVENVIVSQNTSNRVITFTRSVTGATANVASVLTFKTLQISDAGGVMCLASDSSGEVKASRRVALSVFRELAQASFYWCFLCHLIILLFLMIQRIAPFSSYQWVSERLQ